MRLLWLAPYLPVPTFGGGTRTFNLIKTMSGTCEIDLIAGDETPPDQVPAELRALCRKIDLFPRPASSRRQKRWLQLRSLVSRRSAQHWMLYSAAMQQQIDQAIRETRYDAIIVEHSFTGCYTLPGDQVVVLDQHNVESEIFRRAGQHERSFLRRAYNVVEYWRYRAEEQRICSAADLVLATSALDQQTMQRWPELPPCIVVPNAVDSDYFAPMESIAGDGQPLDVLFVGSMHYAPNTEAMLFFTEKIWPRVRAEAPTATLTIVGMNPPPEIQALGERPEVSIVGFVPDVRPYLAGAKVVVAPLRIGGGTRLKILEAMSMGAAVVSTSIGCEGLEVQHGQHLLVVDEPAAFAERVIALLGSPEQRLALGREGRRLVEDMYDWRSLGSHLETAIASLLGRNQNWKGKDGDESAAGVA